MDKKSRVTLCIFLLLILCSFQTYSQDSITAVADVNEKHNIEFQENFFKALSHKAIYNYQKAIEHLEKCNELIPDKKSVLFELSKNYFKLNRTVESLEFINLALQKDSDNLWLLEHRVQVLKRMADFNEAIKTQEKIAEKYPNKKQRLVFLHLQNKDLNSAKRILTELAEAKLLNSRLRNLQNRLNNKALKPVKKNIEVINADLKLVFQKEKSYKNLKLLLESLVANNTTNLLKFSEEGLALFPAQPFVYLMNGKALNQQKEYKKALDTLQNGIDFVIDDNETEAKFYLEMATAYKGLKNSKKANTFKNKAAKLLK